MKGGVDLLDLLPGHAQGIGPPALRPGDPSRQPTQPLRQPPRIEALADEKGGDARWAVSQLDVIDPPPALTVAVEELLVHQAVEDEALALLFHPPPPFVISSKGMAAIASVTMTAK